MNKTQIILVLLLSLFVLNTSKAEDSYVRFGITQSTADMQAPSYNNLFTNNDDSVALTLVTAALGYKLHPFFNVELSVSTGLAEEDILQGPETINGNVINYDVTLETTLFATVYAVGQYPILPGLHIQGRVGFGYGNYYRSLYYSQQSGSNGSEGPEEGFGVAWGAGLSYVSGQHGVALFYDTLPELDIGGDDVIETTGISLLYQYHY